MLSLVVLKLTVVLADELVVLELVVALEVADDVEVVVVSGVVAVKELEECLKRKIA